MTCTEAITKYMDYISQIPARDQRYGKTKKYEKVTLRIIQSSLKRFFLHILGDLEKDISEVTREQIKAYVSICEAEQKIGAYAHKKFFIWAHENGLVKDSFSDLKTYCVATKVRRIPAMRKEKWEAIRNAPRFARDRVILALLFNQMRVDEICNLRWESCPNGYFEEYQGATMVNVKRKGGEVWPIKIDRRAWIDLRIWWQECGMPSEGSMISTNPTSVRMIFKKYRDRILYRPEDKTTRDQITPHSIRHYAAKKFCLEHPELAATIGEVIGGWKPGSATYKTRYLNVRELFPEMWDRMTKLTPDIFD